jgi:hypothetical protein
MGRALFLMAAIMRATSSVVSGWMPPARVRSFDDIEHAIAQQFGELSERPFLIHPARFVYSPRAGAHACEITHSGQGMEGTVCWTRRTLRFARGKIVPRAIIGRTHWETDGTLIRRLHQAFMRMHTDFSDFGLDEDTSPTTLRGTLRRLRE